MRDELWCRIEAALDARRSPFDDAALAAELRAEPASEAAVRRLLASLERVAAAPVRRAARLRQASAAAAVLLLGATSWLASRAWNVTASSTPAGEFTLVVEHESPPPARGARVELAPRRVVAWTQVGGTP